MPLVIAPDKLISRGFFLFCSQVPRIICLLGMNVEQMIVTLACQRNAFFVSGRQPAYKPQNNISGAGGGQGK